MDGPYAGVAFQIDGDTFGSNIFECHPQGDRAVLYVDTTGSLWLGAALYDGTGSAGTSGQFLSSTVTGVEWVAAPSVVGYTVVSKTANYNAVANNDVWCSGTFTVTSPAAGAAVRFKVTNRGTGTITISPVSGTINGQASYTIERQYTAVEFASDGTNWDIE
jgi:hypothetical protein